MSVVKDIEFVTAQRDSLRELFLEQDKLMCRLIKDMQHLEDMLRRVIQQYQDDTIDFQEDCLELPQDIQEWWAKNRVPQN